MNPGTLRALEFDRIVHALAALTITPMGHDRTLELRPSTDAARVAAALHATTEATRLLAASSGLPLRSATDLATTLDALGVQGRPLEPLRLLGLADFLESVDASRVLIRRLTGGYPILSALAERAASFRNEAADVRRRIDPAGEVADNASAALASIRDRLRRQRTKLRNTLDGIVRGRDTARYLQDQVVTDRNGRYVLMVRAEHRGAIPGLVHGASASGATLFLEPLATVEINNELVTLHDAEAEEVRRILLELTDAFRGRPADLARTIDVATELDVIQARGRLSERMGGIEPVTASDGTFELRGARHPLLIPGVATIAGVGRAEADREETSADDESRDAATLAADAEGTAADAAWVPPGAAGAGTRAAGGPVPVDLLLLPPTRVLVIAGPNTGGKTVALKTAGLLSVMAQSGLHVPANPGSKLPVFAVVFADIGDEQSIAASLSTFSAHITNVVAMDRALALPALILLDEVGAGTDPIEGGALGTAVIDHFRGRGAHLIATTHYDALKTYAATTAGVMGAGFGFDPETYAPTYRLVYGSPGRSLALEIASRLGMPGAVIDTARANLTDREQQLMAHLARVDRQLQQLETERRQLSQERLAVADTERRLRGREESVREREAALRRRLEGRLEDQLRSARKEIDTVLEALKVRATELREARRAGTATTAAAGELRREMREAIDGIAQRVRRDTGAAVPVAAAPQPEAAASAPVAPGVRVLVGALGLEGTVLDLRGTQAEIEVRGKRMRAPIGDLRVIGRASDGSVRVQVALQPRAASLSELNLVGCTVDEALARAEKFLDDSTVTDQQTLRIIHGHGTGQLRRAIAGFLRDHPLVARFEAAPADQGGGGVTLVQLKD
jgi:DNA mismatch repair protein MutS2